MGSLYHIPERYDAVLRIIEEDGGEVTAAHLNMLRSLDEDFNNVAEVLGRKIRELEATVEAKKAESRRLKEEAAVLEARSERLRETAIRAIQAVESIAGGKVTPGVSLVLSVIQNPKAVEVLDAALVPEPYASWTATIKGLDEKTLNKIQKTLQQKSSLGELHASKVVDKKAVADAHVEIPGVRVSRSFRLKIS